MRRSLFETVTLSLTLLNFEKVLLATRYILSCQMVMHDVRAPFIYCQCALRQ